MNGLEKFLAVIGILAVAFTCFDLVPRVYDAAKREDIADKVDDAPVDLSGQQLSDGSFAGASLTRADMSEAVFTNWDFDGANLSSASIRNSSFPGSNFSGAVLCGVDARGADLSAALNLDKVKTWNFVLYDETTTLPPGLDFEFISGPVPDTGRGVPYTCDDLTVQLLGRPK